MRWHLIFSLALALIACGARAEDPAAPPEVNLHREGHGWVLTDTKGMTLYTTADDKDGKVSCEGTCAKTWPPVMAGVDAKPFGDWGLAARADGSRQWAFKGRPLYTYSPMEAC